MIRNFPARTLRGVCNPEGSYPGDGVWTLSAFLDLLCTKATTANTITSISPTSPDSPMNPNVCYGGGPLLDQSACLAAQAQTAAQVRASDPAGAAAYDCLESPSPALCTLGLNDINGNITIPTWAWIAGGLAIFAIFEK